MLDFQRNTINEMTETIASWPLIHTSLAFFALMMVIISFWVKRSPWIWGGFLVFALVLGYFAQVITPIALAPIGALFAVHILLAGDLRGLARFLLVLIATALSLGLLAHKFPGFHNFVVFQNVRISPSAAPYSLYLNFDKPFIGICVLACGLPLIHNLRELERVLKIALPLIIGGIAIMIYFALFSGIIEWDPKYTPRLWAFAIINLMFVSIIEEAFWRGFLQNEVFRWLGKRGYLANVGCVFITAALFGGLHYLFVPNLLFVALAFIAGIVYGAIYQYTKALEASIFCHWLLNLVHFTLFTYPVLQSSL